MFLASCQQNSNMYKYLYIQSLSQRLRRKSIPHIHTGAVDSPHFSSYPFPKNQSRHLSFLVSPSLYVVTKMQFRISRTLPEASSPGYVLYQPLSHSSLFHPFKVDNALVYSCRCKFVYRDIDKNILVGVFVCSWVGGLFKTSSSTSYWSCRCVLNIDIAWALIILPC